MIGRVVSVKMKNTAVILVDIPKIHPIYKKGYMNNKKYLADDQLGVSLGDVVEFIQCKPISKRKTWKVVKVLGKDEVALGKEIMKEVASEAIAEVLPEQVEELKLEEVKKEEKIVKKSASTKKGAIKSNK